MTGLAEAGKGNLLEHESRSSRQSSRFPSSPHNQLITLNISGLKFQTYTDTLDRFPTSLLGNPLKRQQFYLKETEEYFFDRHRQSFEAILYWYQSNGRIRRPDSIPVDVFLKEMKFFQLPPEAIERFWISEGYRKPEVAEMPKNSFQRRIWQYMEHPDTSLFARFIAFLSVFVIVVSIVSLCLETLPHFKEPCPDTHQNGSNVSTMAPPLGFVETPADAHSCYEGVFFILETVCIVWFTFELLMRFISSPSKKIFLKGFLNWVDLIAIVPFFINLIFADASGGTSIIGSDRNHVFKVGGNVVEHKIIWILRVVEPSDKGAAALSNQKTLPSVIAESIVFGCLYIKENTNFLSICACVLLIPAAFCIGSKGGAMSFAVLRVLRLVRVFRIFKLSRHSRGLQILGMTFKASVRELLLLVFFLAIGLVLFASAIYFAEAGTVGSHFTSIPAAFWYAIVTMTTVGYGDMYPKSTVGKLVGSCCAILGVLVLALPVPVIVANFKHFYRQETRLAMYYANQNEDDDENVADNHSVSS